MPKSKPSRRNRGKSSSSQKSGHQSNAEKKGSALGQAQKLFLLLGQADASDEASLPAIRGAATTVVEMGLRAFANQNEKWFDALEKWARANPDLKAKLGIVRFWDLFFSAVTWQEPLDPTFDPQEEQWFQAAIFGDAATPFGMEVCGICDFEGVEEQISQAAFGKPGRVRLDWELYGIDSYEGLPDFDAMTAPMLRCQARAHGASDEQIKGQLAQLNARSALERATHAGALAVWESCDERMRAGEDMENLNIEKDPALKSLFDKTLADRMEELFKPAGEGQMLASPALLRVSIRASRNIDQRETLEKLEAALEGAELSLPFEAQGLGRSVALFECLGVGAAGQAFDSFLHSGELDRLDAFVACAQDIVEPSAETGVRYMLQPVFHAEDIDDEASEAAGQPLFVEAFNGYAVRVSATGADDGEGFVFGEEFGPFLDVREFLARACETLFENGVEPGQILMGAPDEAREDERGDLFPLPTGEWLPAFGLEELDDELGDDDDDDAEAGDGKGGDESAAANEGGAQKGDA